MFRLLSHLQALQGTDPRKSKILVHFGIPNAYNGRYNNCKCTCVCSYNILVYTMDYNLKFKTIKGFVKQLCYMVDRYVYKLVVHNVGTFNRDLINGVHTSIPSIPRYCVWQF